MPRPVLAFVFSALLVVATCTFGADPDFSKATAKVKRFVEDVAFTEEAGDIERVSKRWLALPRLEVKSTSAEMTAYAEKAVRQINAASGLAVTEGPALTIYIGPSRELAKLALGIDKRINIQGGATYWISWGKQKDIVVGSVFLFTDRTGGEKAKDLLLTNILGAYGFPSTSKEFDETAFTSLDKVFTGLTPLDTKVIRFFYTHVPPGQTAQEVKRIVEASWEK